jgi:hypothetical protein
MIEKNDLQRMISDIEFRWVSKKTVIKTDHPIDLIKEEKVLQYRVQKGDGFRGWTDWQEVKNETSE